LNVSGKDVSRDPSLTRAVVRRALPRRSTWSTQAWRWAPWVVLAGGLALAVHTALAARSDIEHRAQLRIGRHAERLQIGLERRLQSFENILRSAAALFARDGRTTAAQWTAFVEGLDLPARVPDAEGIGFIVPVRRADLADYLAQRERDGEAIPHVTTEGGHPDLFLIQYHAPRQPGSIAIGFDVGAVPVNRAAIETARDTGRPRLAAPLPLQATRGAALQYPVYSPGPAPTTVGERRRRFLGCASLLFLTTPFVEGLLRGGDPDIEVDLYIGDQAVETRKLFGLGIGGPTSSAVGRQTAVPLTIAGQPGLMVLGATPAFDRSQGTRRPLAVFGAGFAMSLLAALLAWSMARTHRNALDLAARMTRSLSAALQRHDLHLGQTPLAVIEWDTSGRVTIWNAAAERTFGIGAGEAIGRDARGILASAETPSDVWDAIFGDQAGHWSTIGRRPDGTALTCAWHITALVDDQGRAQGAAAIVEDTTQRTSLEARLRHSQKLEAVGRLAGGIAHDFNNLLTAILGHADLARAGLAVDDPRRDNLEEIVRAGDRAASLTRQLLTFARRQVSHPRVVDVNRLVNDTERLLRPMLGERVAFDVHLASNLRAVRGDPGQIEQVVMNLAINARDAMPDGGRLTIATSNADLDPEQARGRGVAPGPFVVLAVTDTGHGMSDEVLARVFEPFFTTKDGSVGTGLGLPMCHGIVEQHGGFIAVETQPGGGSSFAVWFPSTEDRPSDVPATPAPVGPARPMRALVVEDNQLVRVMVRRVLVSRGCDVVEASGGAEALDLIARDGRLDIVLSDVVMPGMSGPDLARRLRECRPDLPVLFMSGYADEVVARDPGTRDVEFLHKPFKPDELWHRIVALTDPGSRSRPAGPGDPPRL
jgi:PAS domain S-box-containing protein